MQRVTLNATTNINLFSLLSCHSFVLKMLSAFYICCIYSSALQITFLNEANNMKSKKWCKDQESIQSSTTPDPGYQWESDKLTEDTESQEVSPFPAGDHKAHINRRAQNIANTRQNKNIKDPQKKYRLGTVSKIFYWRA